jgi:hypothetical protein
MGLLAAFSIMKLCSVIHILNAISVGVIIPNGLAPIELNIAAKWN